MSVASDRLEVYCHDVGQGDCTVVVPPEGEGDPILFDCGDAYVAERFFANHEIQRLEAVVVSHLDIDHIRGVLPFLRQHFARGGEVGRLVIGLDRTEGGDAATELIGYALDLFKTPPHEGFELVASHRASKPLKLLAGTGWSVELVLPFYGTALGAQHEGDAPNLASVVLRVQRQGSSLLIGGDAPLGSWERLDPTLLRSNTIRVSHHGGDILEGGREWTSYEALYDAVKAERAVISVGSNNGYDHPLREHVTAARRGSQCRILCTQMTAKCHKQPRKVRADALVMASSLEYPYRHLAQPGFPMERNARDEVPCAGTVLLSIDRDGKVFVRPKPALHAELLDALDHPLCRD